jgi:hypothetical protein
LSGYTWGSSEVIDQAVRIYIAAYTPLSNKAIYVGTRLARIALAGEVIRPQRVYGDQHNVPGRITCVRPTDHSLSGQQQKQRKRCTCRFFTIRLLS